MNTEISTVIQHKELIIDSVIAWQKENYPNRTQTYSKCYRDLNYVLNAYINDLLEGTITYTATIGSKFWHCEVRQINDYLVEVAVHNFLVDFINTDIVNNAPDFTDKLTMLKNTFISIIINGSTQPHTLLDDARTFQRCQRNWDLSKTVPKTTAKWLLDIGYSAPTKQNMDNFEIVCITDRTLIETISEAAVSSPRNRSRNLNMMIKGGRVQNPQVNSNILFAFFVKPQERTSEIRDHRVGGEVLPESVWYEHSLFELGIAAGSIGVAATSIGLKTGFCRCINYDALPQAKFEEYNLNKYDLIALLGAGYPLYEDSTLHTDGKHTSDSNKKYTPRNLII